MKVKTNVTLKKIDECDLDKFYLIAKENRVKKFVKLFYPNDMQEAEKIIRMLSKNSDYLAFAILDKNQRLVGVISGERKGNEIIEVSYFIGSRYRKNGYCIEAITLYEKYLQENTSIKEMQFQIDSSNKSSIDVMKRLNIKKKCARFYEIYSKKIK